MFVLYCVYDKKAKLYSMPVTLSCDAEAARFTKFMMDNNAMIEQFASDFALYRMASVDDDGFVAANNPPIYVCDFASAKDDDFSFGEDGV